MYDITAKYIRTEDTQGAFPTVHTACLETSDEVETWIENKNRVFLNGAERGRIHNAKVANEYDHPADVGVLITKDGGDGVWTFEITRN